jgi:ketosteroid isomerase-like protein
VSGARELALGFFDALAAHDAGAAMGLVAPDARFEIVPARIEGTAREEGPSFVVGLLRAMPDLTTRTRVALDTPTLAVVEVTMEGTQAASFLGILNQEKHFDLDQVWMVWAEGGKIARLRAYWCQNQLYRRLAVRRLDRVSILG